MNEYSLAKVQILIFPCLLSGSSSVPKSFCFYNCLMAPTLYPFRKSHPQP